MRSPGRAPPLGAKLTGRSPASPRIGMLAKAEAASASPEKVSRMV